MSICRALTVTFYLLLKARNELNLILWGKWENRFLSLQAPKFTRDPEKLPGERIKCQLVKCPDRGIGIKVNTLETEEGSEAGDNEFLQIEEINPDGPALEDGTLMIGQFII